MHRGFISRCVATDAPRRFAIRLFLRLAANRVQRFLRRSATPLHGKKKHQGSSGAKE